MSKPPETIWAWDNRGLIKRWASHGDGKDTTEYTRIDTITNKLRAAGEMAGALRLLDTEEALPEYAINALQKWKEAQDDK